MTKGISKNARETYVEQLSKGRGEILLLRRFSKYNAHTKTRIVFICYSGLTGGTNKKYEPFTNINSSDKTDFAYRSTSNFLRQSVTSLEMNTGRGLVRTRSATDLTPRSNNTRPFFH